MPSRLTDLSHVVEHGMVTYEGVPAPVMGDVLSREASRETYAPGTDFQIGRPVHTILLGHDSPIVEQLCGRSQPPNRGSRFLAVPVKLKAFGSFPVRAFAII